MKRSKTYKIEALLITLLLAIITSKVNKLIETNESEKNMEFYINNCLEDNILDFNHADTYPNNKKQLLIRGDVLKEYMEENNIELIVVGDFYITEEERVIKVIKYIENEEEKTIYYPENQDVNIPNILSIETVTTLSISDIERKYNITTIKNIFDITKDFLDTEEPSPFKLSLNFNK